MNEELQQAIAETTCTAKAMAITNINGDAENIFRMVTYPLRNMTHFSKAQRQLLNDNHIRVDITRTGEDEIQVMHRGFILKIDTYANPVVTVDFLRERYVEIVDIWKSTIAGLAYNSLNKLELGAQDFLYLANSMDEIINSDHIRNFSRKTAACYKLKEYYALMAQYDIDQKEERQAAMQKYGFAANDTEGQRVPFPRLILSSNGVCSIMVFDWDNYITLSSKGRIQEFADGGWQFNGCIDYDPIPDPELRPVAQAKVARAVLV